MQKNYYVNMWLRYMLRLMKERKGMVNQSATEGHIRKGVFSGAVDDIADNIHSAEHLVRMILLWARDSELMGNKLFDDGWAALGEFAKKLMKEHERNFAKDLQRRGKREEGRGKRKEGRGKR